MFKYIKEVTDLENLKYVPTKLKQQIQSTINPLLIFCAFIQSLSHTKNMGGCL